MTSSLPGVLVMVNTLAFGGAEKHAVSLANHLDPARFRVSFCHLKADPPVAAAATLADQLDRSRVEALLCLNVRRKLDWRAVTELARAIDSLHIDVILCTNGYPLLYALLAARLARRPVRLVEVFHSTGFQTPIKSRLRMLVNALAFRQCALIVYVSQRQREYWHARGLRGQRDMVIYNGIDTAHFTDRYSPEQKTALRAQFGYAPDDYVIGICAGLRPEKAHGDLLLGLSRLRAAGVAARLLIIGDGPQRPFIEQRIAELQLQDSVAITGYQRDVRPYIACCDVMTLTSIETFSIAALEAMSLGKPMVMGCIGGGAEQVADGTSGLLFQPGDVEALARHLQTLADRERRSTMGAAAAQAVRERFTIQRMVATFTAELQKLTDASLRLTSTVPN
ncbi:MAG TPA: glycosyltransferase family 4 protein [Steroidobacteraceae bacterium]|nr:glycosyltransferase family 4 protein [Steroidobacteraceae bacterium]